MPAEPAKGPIQHIVCPVDASESSEFSLTYAGVLARQMGARITVLHVFELATDVFPDDAVPLRNEVEERLRAPQRVEVEEMVERCLAGVNTSCEMLDGVPYQVICERAKALGADLILMGTHGRSGVQRLLIGSVAERVVRNSVVPVMTVHKPGIG